MQALWIIYIHKGTAECTFFSSFNASMLWKHYPMIKSMHPRNKLTMDYFSEHNKQETSDDFGNTSLNST